MKWRQIQFYRFTIVGEIFRKLFRATGVAVFDEKSLRDAF